MVFVFFLQERRSRLISVMECETPECFARFPSLKPRMTDDPKDLRPIRSSTSRRGTRRGLRRSKTLVVRRLSRDEIAEATALIESLDHLRPAARGDCRAAQRPCPWISCKYHLYLDVNPHTGSIKLNFPDKEVWEMDETCALDVADHGGITLEQVGTLLNLTRERIRQIELSGLQKLRAFVDDEAEPLPEEAEEEEEDFEDED